MYGVGVLLVRVYCSVVGRGEGRAQSTFMMDSASCLLVDTYIEKLIQEIEKRPALYKKNLKEYSDVNQKIKLWEGVCEAVVPNWNELGAEDKTKQSIIFILITTFLNHFIILTGNCARWRNKI